jgi:hypothetical protein
MGDEEEEEMSIASASGPGRLGRRRFATGCVGSAILEFSLFSWSSSSRSELVSSISSFLWIGNTGGRWGRRERGEECCVAGVAFSLVGFCVELKLNRGAGANCWEEEGCAAFCWKRRDELGLGVGLLGWNVRKRCGDRV